MEEKNISIISYYQKELKRIAWRLQYHAKVKRKRETSLSDYLYSTIPAPDSSQISQTDIQDLINMIPFDTGKQIIYKLYIEDKSETHVAREMKMSQQAVSKWKKNCLNYLYQKMSS